MGMDQQHETIKSHYQQLANGAAALRRRQEQYTTLRYAAHAADLAEVTARYAVQRRAAKERRQTQNAAADAVFVQESAVIYTLWQQVAAVPDWAATR